MAWEIKYSDLFQSKLKKTQKKHFHEVEATLDNVEKYRHALIIGVNPMQIKAGYIHQKYPLGIKSIDQKGGKQKGAQVRLYIYPEVAEEILYLISIGTKNTQQQDVKECKKYVESLMEQKKES